ncbi:hypothetical protein HOLleu_17506 [Holothuria leucospilota]|uniref:Uncharacterized protein n=1 Tax=Holothuria leucospilota TaxID=206669 RepID=A0A9Q1C293_HOLLE|nr:hypothetical protein HOLleu_17506 [Holothuria leucospilota]
MEFSHNYCCGSLRNTRLLLLTCKRQTETRRATNRGCIHSFTKDTNHTRTHVHPTQEDNMAFQLEDLPPSYEDAIKILPPPPVYNSTVTTISDTVR